MDDLAKRIEKIKDSARSDPNAVGEMIAIVAEFPEDPYVWCELAYVRSRRGDRVSAVGALAHAIELAPDEPVYLFDRARFNLVLGEYQSVIDDASRGLEVSERLQFFSYKDLLLFLRAYAQAALHDDVSARNDLATIGDRDMRFWINGLVTWDDLARRCGMDISPQMPER
ncbi:hypothetical protein KPL74_00405 [Bacillus sp. NP157]|nr:hypothetical protein KPL74_00405 [Bacillus sp. NP157]